MGAASERLEKKLLGLVETAAKALILEIDKELRKRGSGTPVDTGHARASWVPSVGSPVRAEPDGNSSAAHDAGVAQVLTYRIGGGSLYLTNAAPYIRRLNDGWSSQAPALFIEACIDRAMSMIKAKLGVDFGQTAFRASTGGGAANVASAYSPFGDD
jgi:hypothetical protein